MPNTIVAAGFHEKNLAFTTDGKAETTFADFAVPGIGKAGRAALQAKGISNAAQVVGWFLRVNGDRERFGELLIENGCDAGWVNRAGVGTVAAVAEKCSSYVLEEPDGPVAATGQPGMTQVSQRFERKQLSFADTFDSNPVPGLGRVGRACLLSSAFRITNAVQLVGHFMVLNGDEQMFLTFLTADLLTGEGCGIQARHARTVLEAVQDKVAPFCSA